MLLGRDFWTGRHQPLLEADKGAAAGGGSGTEGEHSAGADADKGKQEAGKSDQDEKLGEAGMAALQKEREAREAAEKEAKRLKKIVDDAEAATRKREADEAKAKGDFEALAKKAQEERDALQAQLTERDRRDLKRSIAAKHRLPADLADRLMGDDEAALEEDAKKLAKTVGTREAPDTEGGAGERGSAGTSDRPMPKKSKDEEAKPAYTFDGKPLVAWPGRS